MSGWDLNAENMKIIGTDCGCRACIDARPNKFGLSMLPNSASVMCVCALCGNKRCPRASHHDNPCTGSNEVGQPGSVYGGVVCPEYQHELMVTGGEPGDYDYVCLLCLRVFPSVKETP
jgi:hypothetical protein